MSVGYINDTTLTGIANAIREKNGESGLYLPSEMAAKIAAIEGGGEYNLITHGNMFPSGSATFLNSVNVTITNTTIGVSSSITGTVNAVFGTHEGINIKLDGLRAGIENKISFKFQSDPARYESGYAYGYSLRETPVSDYRNDTECTQMSKDNDLHEYTITITPIGTTVYLVFFFSGYQDETTSQFSITDLSLSITSVISSDVDLLSTSITSEGEHTIPEGYDGYGDLYVHDVNEEYTYAETMEILGGREPVLPAEYQRVEYLDFTPSIGILVTIPTTTALYEVTFSVDDISRSELDAFGYRVSTSDGKDFEFGVHDGDTAFFIRNEIYGTPISGFDESYTADTVITTKAVLISPRSTALIGKYAHYSTSESNNEVALDGKFYSIKARELDEYDIIAWLVPCYRISDNQVGVYDHIAGAFYYETYSTGSGYSIVAGPDVN